MSGIPTERRQDGAAVSDEKDPGRYPDRAPESGAPVSGIILAGGYSSRMGSSKAELPFGKTDLIHFQAEKLRSIGVTDILISGYDVTVEGTRCIPDLYPHRGPLSGIHASLAAAENDACLVLSVDAPLVPPDFLKTLIRSHTRGITMAAHDGKSEPLIAVYDTSLASACEKLLLENRRAVRALLDYAECREYVCERGELLLNCNTPEEYRRALALAEAQ